MTDEMFVDRVVGHRLIRIKVTSTTQICFPSCTWWDMTRIGHAPRERVKLHVSFAEFPRLMSSMRRTTLDWRVWLKVQDERKTAHTNL